MDDRSRPRCTAPPSLRLWARSQERLWVAPTHKGPHPGSWRLPAHGLHRTNQGGAGGASPGKSRRQGQTPAAHTLLPKVQSRGRVRGEHAPHLPASWGPGGSRQAASAPRLLPDTHQGDQTCHVVTPQTHLVTRQLHTVMLPTPQRLHLRPVPGSPQRSPGGETEDEALARGQTQGPLQESGAPGTEVQEPRVTDEGSPLWHQEVGAGL